MKKELLIIGYGYCAFYLSKVLSKDDWNIYAITRSNQKKIESDVKIISWYDYEKIENIIKKIDLILVCVPPSEGQDPFLKNFSNLFLNKNFSKKWIGYLSSTSVYGDHKGAWVDENTKLLSKSKLGKTRIGVENDWINFSKQNNIDLTIFRLAGIYGPERNPFKNLNDKNYRFVVKKNHIFNRIHVEDIANIIMSYLLFDKKDFIFNLSDGYPSSNFDFVKEASLISNSNLPKMIPYDMANLSPIAKSFFEESKRVSNSKIKKFINYKFLYPNFKTGLRSLVNN